MNTVLIVEDDQTLQGLYKDYFEAAGLAILQVYDGLEALNILKGENQVELVVLDLMLPRTSGYEVLNHIRLQQDHIPVVVVSAVADVHDAIGPIRRGKVTYISKGEISLREIVNRILEYFRKNTLSDPDARPLDPTSLTE